MLTIEWIATQEKPGSPPPGSRVSPRLVEQSSNAANVRLGNADLRCRRSEALDSNRRGLALWCDVDVDEGVACGRSGFATGMDRTGGIEIGEVVNREQITTERTETGDHLDHPATGTQVADVTFGGGDRRLSLGLAEDFCDCLGFLLVALLRPQTMGMNVPERFGIRLAEGSAQHVGNRTLEESWIGSRPNGGTAVTNDLTQDVGTSGLGMFERSRRSWRRPPRPTTLPSRVRSKGRDIVVGSS